MKRRIVIISGAPGSGKTTLAGPLAAELGLPLFTKDTVKETLDDMLGDQRRDGVEWSSRLGAAAMELLWRLAGDAPACVLEANFLPGHERQRQKLSELTQGGLLVEVYCACPAKVADSRYQARHGTPARHRIHTNNMTLEGYAAYAGPVGLGPVVEVDTTTRMTVAEVAERVRSEAVKAGLGLTHGE
ncbi:AAA family ATPase [Actinospica durhamensis]|uniref:AAA family ATPase n=1 Tax=Actinospica durhamensis TaxID=1508375 RepID=A0A941IPD8_9ACTN|nr:AAA family ATPase [Actinospica durhamensis]MBR7831853.1 AAA family ATPase [Actinospica durhamensis]